MADKIKVNTVTLDKDTQNVIRRLEKVKKKIECMQDDVKALNSMWEGAANKKFNEVFLKDIQTVLTLCGLFDDIVEYEELAKSEYDKCEGKVSSLIEDMKI